jgi:hypothetical protein
MKLLLLSKNIKIRIYKTIILPLVLYGSETLSLTLREEYRLRVFENRVLRIFEPKRDEVKDTKSRYYYYCIFQNYLNALQKGVLKDKAWLEMLAVVSKGLSPCSTIISE